jgi:thiol-disulfide isomerase/thioredoxin
MKNILIALFVLHSIAGYSNNQVTVFGKVTNAGIEPVIITNNMYYIGKTTEVYKAPLKDNNYSISFNLDHNRVLTFSYKEKTTYLYLEPGDSINVSFDGNSILETLHFTGKGGDNNTILYKFNETFKNEFDKAAMEARMKTGGVDAFEMSIFNDRKKETAVFNEHPDKAKTSSGFQKYMQQRIQYNYWNHLLAYPIVNANSNKGLTVSPLPPVMLESLNKSKASNDTALIADSYRSFLTYYITYLASEANGFNKFTDVATSMQKKYYVANQYLKDESFRYFLAKYMYDECERTDAETIKKVFNVLAWSDNNGGYSKIVKEHCTKFMEAKSATDPGSSPTLKLTDLKGKQHSLADFKGKVVYIDFWASWCGPCRQQFPYAKELRKQLSEKEKKQIEFVYVSIDNTEDVWKSGITANGLEGFQLFSPGGWNSEAVKYFKINGIPRYMLLDKKGNIVDPNAKRPSDPQILEDLRKLL